MFRNLGKNYYYKKLLTEPLTYVAGATLLALFQIAHFSILGSGWGVTGPLMFWGGWFLQALGFDVASWGIFASESAQATLASPFWMHAGTVRNIGIILGALASVLLASQFKIKKIKSGKQVVGAILGGFLMGYGARLARGCNIGGLFTGIISFSLSGWVLAIFLLLGAFLGSKLLAKFFM